MHNSITLYNVTAIISWKDDVQGNLDFKIEDIQSADEVEIRFYPNPISDAFQICGLITEGEFTLLSDDGSIIVTQKIKMINDVVFVKALPKGKYKVVITTIKKTIVSNLFKLESNR